MQALAEGIDRLREVVPEGLWPWLAVAVGLVAAILVHRILWAVVSRMAAGRSGLVARLIPRLRRPARLAIMVLAASLLVQAASLSPDWREGLTRVSVAVLIVIAGWMVLIAIDVSVERATRHLRLDVEDNLAARKQATQMRVLARAAKVLVWLLTAATVLATFETVRRYGVSLFASAGAAGIVLGFAARPVLANLIAGIQIALTQPIRIDDVVIVEDEWGWIEEIASTYVVVRIWDLRRLVVPLSRFIEEPFQNWTRDNARIIGTVTWHLDYTAPIGAMREKLKDFAEESPHWDRDVLNLQVVEAEAETILVRALLSARNSPTAWDLRCEIREKMICWLQEAHPGALPRIRGELSMESREAGVPAEGPGPGSDGSGVPRAAQPEGEGGSAQP